MRFLNCSMAILMDGWVVTDTREMLSLGPVLIEIGWNVPKGKRLSQKKRMVREDEGLSAKCKHRIPSGGEKS